MTVQHIKYDSFEEHLAENPDCCAINSEDGYDIPPITFFARLTSNASGDVVVIDFKIRYLDAKGNQQMQVVRLENGMQNCALVTDY
ncbi:MAG: hypothetical protein F6K19_26835 [Cyanothece sp. SIO1E1]|nr:hypothetical protein [Cyanothece sp. SIO1E1]